MEIYFKANVHSGTQEFAFIPAKLLCRPPATDVNVVQPSGDCCLIQYFTTAQTQKMKRSPIKEEDMLGPMYFTIYHDYDAAIVTHEMKGIIH